MDKGKIINKCKNCKQLKGYKGGQGTNVWYKERSEMLCLRNRVGRVNKRILRNVITE